MDGNGTSQERPANDELERIRAIGRRIRMKRTAEGLTLGRAAEQSSVSAPTLSRLERQAMLSSKNSKGLIIPDTRTLAAVLSWLGDDYGEDAERIEQDAGRLGVFVEGRGAETPQIVEAYLRADRNLDPITAGMLAEMFRLAYEQYSAMSNAKKQSPPDTAQQLRPDDRPDE